MVALAWEDCRFFGCGQTDLIGTRVVDGGAMDPVGIGLETGSGYQEFPSAVFGNGRFYFAWAHDGRAALSYRTVSVDGGLGAVTAVRGSRGEASAMSVDREGVLLFWEDWLSSNGVSALLLLPDG